MAGKQRPTTIFYSGSVMHKCRNGVYTTCTNCHGFSPVPFVQGLYQKGHSKISGNGFFKEMGKLHFFHCFSRLFHPHHLSNSSFQVNALLLSYSLFAFNNADDSSIWCNIQEEKTQEQRTKITKAKHAFCSSIWVSCFLEFSSIFYPQFFRFHSFVSILLFCIIFVGLVFPLIVQLSHVMSF